tara:strand:+ start:469 stop:1062 length:594 start_codon:yes stop_codon:yes gene_type:complete
MAVKGSKVSLKGALSIGFFLGIWGIVASSYAYIEGEGESFAIIANYSLMMLLFPLITMVGAYASSNLGVSRSDAIGSAIISSAIGNVLAQFFGYLVIVVSVASDFSASELSEIIISVSSLVLSLAVGLLAGIFRISVTVYEVPEVFDEPEPEKSSGPDVNDNTRRIVMQLMGVEKRLTDVESTLKSERFNQLLYGQQ